MTAKIYQIHKYSKRHRRNVKKTINPSKMNEDEIKTITENFYKEIEDDNIKFKAELDEIKKSKTIPLKYKLKTDEPDQVRNNGLDISKLTSELGPVQNPNGHELMKNENIEILSTETTPEGQIKTKIETENGITSIKNEIEKKTENGEIKTIQKIKAETLF